MSRNFPQLKAGMRGPDVKALQLALKHARGKHARNQANGVYGTGTIKDVFAFKKAHKILPVNGKTAGTRFWKELAEKNLTKQVRDLLLVAEERDNNPMDDVIAEAYDGLANAGFLVYTQKRPMPPSLDAPSAAHGVDCSTFVTLCYKAGGLPDPNGQGYNGYGYTGTLWSNGVSVSVDDLRPGDLTFYGYMRDGTTPGHVAIFVGGGYCISFGSEPGPRKVSTLYRRDYRGARRYRIAA